MNETQRIKCSFRVVDGVNGQLLIAMEPRKDGEEIAVMGSSGCILFELAEGTTAEQAREIARFLEEHIPQVLFAC